LLQGVLFSFMLFFHHFKFAYMRIPIIVLLLTLFNYLGFAQSPPCPIDLKLEVELLAKTCDESGLYPIRVKLSSNPAVPDSVDVWAVNSNIRLGRFGPKDDIVIKNFPRGSSKKDVVRVCYKNIQGCCKTVEFDPPADCPPYCAIKDIGIGAITCATNGTYGFPVKVLVEGTVGPTRVVIYNSKNRVVGGGASTQSIAVQGLTWNGKTKDTIRVCITLINLPPDVATSCCKTFVYELPECARKPPCSITELKAEPGTCKENGSFPVKVSFKYSGNPEDRFTLTTRTGAPLGTFIAKNLPWTIERYPATEGSTGIINVCSFSIAAIPPCCQAVEFKLPCPRPTCQIGDVAVKTGDCNPDGSYGITLNFVPAKDSTPFRFLVAANGRILDSASTTELPLKVRMPANGPKSNVILITQLGLPTCAKRAVFEAPACALPKCVLDAVEVKPAATCNANGTYNVVVNFKGDAAAKYIVTVGGVPATIETKQLPYTVQNVRYLGRAADVVSVCAVGVADCCKRVEYKVPECAVPKCYVGDVTVKTGDCNPDGSYGITLNFAPATGSTPFQFLVAANGRILDSASTTELPLKVRMPANGPKSNVILVTQLGLSTCAKRAVFEAPACALPKCVLDAVEVKPAATCNANGTYNVVVNFKGDAAAKYIVTVGGVPATIETKQLPYTVQNVRYLGRAADVVSVCAVGVADCCKRVEYKVPECAVPKCYVGDVTVKTGDCNPDGSYGITLNFVPAKDSTPFRFLVAANGRILDTASNTELPLKVRMPANGPKSNVIVVTQIGSPTCIKRATFDAPTCTPPKCTLENIEVKPATTCNPDGSYNIVVNFKGDATARYTITVANVGTVIETKQLPFTISNIRYSGRASEVVGICVVGTNNCCKRVEYKVPECTVPACGIGALTVTPGDCNADGTYNLVLTFPVKDSTPVRFVVLSSTGRLLDTASTTELPLKLRLPVGQLKNEVIAVCQLGQNPNCCKRAEYKVPECNNPKCDFKNVKITRTRCVCGKFFVVLTTDGDNNGVTAYVNGKEFGVFPEGAPILIGPLESETDYEFTVVDRKSACKAASKLAKFKCEGTPPGIVPGTVGQAVSAKTIQVAPNPTGDWLQVTAQLPVTYNIQDDQGSVQVFQADGRLAMSTVTANARNFQLDVSTLPSGLYHLVLQTAAGRAEVNFVKE
jgi:hypothetical protein